MYLENKIMKWGGNTASVHKRDEKGRPIAWKSYVVTGKTDNKKEQRKYFYGKTKKECEAKKNEYLGLIEKHIDIDWKKAKLSEMIDDFIEKEKKDSVCISTYNWYCDMAKHIKRDIGDIPLWDVTYNDLQTFLRKLANNNPNTNKPASSTLLKDVRKVLTQSFSWALSCRYIYMNPAEALRTPKAVKSKEPSTRLSSHCLTAEEIGWIINTPHRLQTANMILLYTGMRPEELLALRWKDIDLIDGTIIVNKAIKYDKNKPILGSTKTDNDRTVFMPQELIDYLKEHKSPNEDDIVVANSRGEYYHKKDWQEKYKSYIIDLDILYASKFKSKHDKFYKQTILGWNPYSLRHTSSTMGKFFGIDDRYLADNQGHDVNTMNRYYTEDIESERKKEMQKISYKNITPTVNTDDAA